MCWCQKPEALHCRAVKRLTAPSWFGHAVDMACHELSVPGRLYCADCAREIGENPRRANAAPAE
jgi:hypothetical protein